MITLLKLTPFIDATVAPSPNFDARRAPGIEGIILHATADGGNEAGTLTWLQSPVSKVSCHLLVSRTGDVTRLVGDHQRAWHAGVSSWRGKTDVNSITLGIEIANRNDGEPYTDAQYRQVAEIVAHYCRQGLTIDDVTSHAEIAQERRTDPLGWDWTRFRTLVDDLLRSADVEWRRWFIYDRRSGERPAVDESVIAEPIALPAPPALPALPSGSNGNGRPSGATARISANTPRARISANVTVTPRSRENAKPPFRSRTIWLNGLTMLAAGSFIIGQTLDLAFSVGIDLPREITMWALFGVGMVNIILRFQTDCAIGNCPITAPSGREVARPSGQPTG